VRDIIVLDCTLRDGGYCNNWAFRENNIKKIIHGLISANVEIVECGFLTDRVSYSKDVTKFTDVKQLESFIPEHDDGAKFVLMVNFGEYSVESITERKISPIDGIRVAFHKQDRFKALEFCRKIKEKGYLVFLQPMVTMQYSDDEFTELVRLANDISPYAFYIVDSFGTMNRKTLNHYFDIVEAVLDENILIGFHSHNNLQSAFSNAQNIINKKSDHAIVIDSSIYGMGRGAGNLNSELFLNDLNEELGKKYEIKPILRIMDEVITRFYEENPWGYSLPNYLSAVHMIHPNYAGYLSEMKTLAVDDIDEIFSVMKAEKSFEYDEEYIKQLYIKYMSAGEARNEHLSEVKENAYGKKILLIAPGKNAIIQKDNILEFIEKTSPIIISVNHNYPEYESDYIFISNIRRFNVLDKTLYTKTISTSNIKSHDTYASVDYFKLLNAVDDVRDNAGLMAIKFAIDELGAKDIYIAGLDGYSHDVYSNFETRDMALLASNEHLDKMNHGMMRVITEYEKIVNITFITDTLLL
jgi:4-hydroxy 2-oxovalerate aldolase